MCTMFQKKMEETSITFQKNSKCTRENISGKIITVVGKPFSEKIFVFVHAFKKW